MIAMLLLLLLWKFESDNGAYNVHPVPIPSDLDNAKLKRYTI
jgi:hypothetical protein